MAALFTVIVIVGTICAGYLIFESDDDHDEWRGY